MKTFNQPLQSANTPEDFTPTLRSTVKRSQRGNYERQAVYQILDEGLVCHVGFVVNGQPYVIPTAYGRVGDKLYIHGSPASRMLRTLQEGIEVCLTVTLLDGLVLARSAFHHSMNYQSVVVFGTASVVEDMEEKLAARSMLLQNTLFLGAGRNFGVIFATRRSLCQGTYWSTYGR